MDRRMYNLDCCSDVVTEEIVTNINRCILSEGNPNNSVELLNRFYDCFPLIFDMHKLECLMLSYALSRIFIVNNYPLRYANRIEELGVNEIANIKFIVPIADYHYVTVTRTDENTFRIYNAWGRRLIHSFDINRDEWIAKFNQYLRLITNIKITIDNAIIIKNLIDSLTNHTLDIEHRYNNAADDPDSDDENYEDEDEDEYVPTKDDILQAFFTPLRQNTTVLIDIYTMPGTTMPGTLGGYKKKHLKKRKPKTKKNKTITKRRNTIKRN